MSEGIRTGIIALLISALAAAAVADWKESYRRGRDAYEAGRWSEVVDAMREAIAERPEARSGTGFLGRRYTPRFYLGVALAELGNCRRAVRIFQQSVAQGQIQETVDGREMTLRMRTCRERLEAHRQALDRVRAALRDALAAREALADVERDAGALWQAGEPSLEAMRDQADRVMRQARQRLAEAEKGETVAALTAIRQLADQAAAAFRDTAAEARSRRAELVRQRDETARSDLAETTASAERALRGVRDLAPYPRQLARRVRDLETLTAEASVLRADAGAPMAAVLRQRIIDAQEALNSAAARPPRSLLDAAERFLGGDFAGTLEALDGVRLRARRSRNQICLLRAAAAWSLREATPGTAESPEDDAGEQTAPNEGGDALSESAENAPAPPEADPSVAPEPPLPTPAEVLAAALEACRSLDPAPTPHARYFSPRFVRFFAREMAPPAADEETLDSAETSDRAETET